MRSALTGVALGLLLTGCAVGGADVEAPSPAPRADLAAEAEVAAANTVGGDAPPEPRKPGRRASVAGHPEQGARTGGGRPSGSTHAPDAAPPPAASSPVLGWSSLASLADPAGDHGDGPAYADLRRVSFAERDGDLSVTIELDGTVPGRLARREVEGVGVDLYRTSDDESDYQVFLDGGEGGWRAFLQTPDGFVDFPGTFTVGGRELRVTLPWGALGGRRDATSSVFVDWSEGTGRLATDGTTRVELRPG